MSRYDNLVSMYHRILGGDVEAIKASIAKNATLGLRGVGGRWAYR